MKDNRPVQTTPPTFNDFGEYNRFLVIYEGDRTRDIRFNDINELEKNLEIDLSKLRRAVIYRKTPESIRTGSVFHNSIYEEVPHAENLLRKLQKPYSEARKLAEKSRPKT